MSRFRRLLMSVAVSVMITDLVLVAFACAPETTPSGTRNSIVVELATEPSLLFAGGGCARQTLVQPAFWGKLWRAVKRVGACVGCGITSYDPWCRYCRDGEKSLIRSSK